MSVASYLFLLAFFPLALILFRVLKGPSRQVWLLLTGLLFCAWGAPQRLVLLGCTGYVTYRLGLGMDREDIITDLDQYTDYIHCSQLVTYEQARSMMAGENPVTAENRSERLKQLRQLVKTYDYDSLFQ